MKDKVGSGFYLQLCDVVFILEKVNDCPQKLRAELDEGYAGDNVSNGFKNRFKFVKYIDDPESVEWLESQDWLPDYEKYERMTADEVHALQEQENEKLCEIFIKSFDKDNIDVVKQSYLVETLSVINDYKKNELVLSFPTDVPQVS